jgi:hypothetical protein
MSKSKNIPKTTTKSVVANGSSDSLNITCPACMAASVQMSVSIKCKKSSSTHSKQFKNTSWCLKTHFNFTVTISWSIRH